MRNSRTKMLLMALTGCLLSISASAEDRQIWECRTEQDGAQPILYLVEWGSRSYVKFAHVRFPATHEYDETSGQHGWYWHNTKGYYRYAMALASDGRAWYHDFDDSLGDGLVLDRFRCANAPS